MDFKIRSLLCVLASSFFLTACGDLFMQRKGDTDVNLNQFAMCKLDTTAFSKILERNIRGDILCLRDQLHMFIEIVDTDRVGYVSHKTLSEFIKKGPMKLDQKILPLLESFFDINYIILGGDRGYIPRKDVDKLLDMMIYFNAHIWKVFRYFTSKDEVNYARHSKERNVVYNEFQLVVKDIFRIYKPKRKEFSRIDLDKLIVNVFSEDPEILKKIQSLQFLKKVFLGGSSKELNHIEFEDLLIKLPSIATVAFDLAKVNRFSFVDDQQIMMKVFLQDINTAKRALFYDEKSLEALMTIYDVVGAIETFFPDLSFDLRKYTNEIQTFKEPLLGSGGEFVNNKELLRAFDHAQQILAKGEMFYRIYNYFASELNQPAPITHDFSDFPVTSSYEAEVVKDFARVVNNYQFMKGTFTMPVFHHLDYRNATGYFEISALEYGVKTLMSFYGSAHEKARGGYHMDLEQLYQVMLKLKWILKDAGIITIGKRGGGEVRSATENVVLMATLFQYQSDGCGKAPEPCMEVPEITEFLVGLMAAIGVKNFFSEKMQELCSDEVDEFNRFPVECFRRNFVKVLESRMPDGKTLTDYMPLMYQYIKELTAKVPDGESPTKSASYVKFLTETETFTRVCNYYDKTKPNPESVPMKATDAFAVFAGLINVESTMIRHDVNRNNKLDGLSANLKNNEVMNAYYDVYEGAIKGLVAPTGGFMEKLARPIFMYLIKEGKVPDTSKFKSVWQFVKFMLPWRNKRADASRTSIATILKVIGEQKPGNPFKCEECLRDPTVECTPEGDEWN